MSKKVFSIYKWYKVCNWGKDGLSIDEAVRKYHWTLDCEGKGRYECCPYIITDNWVVPVEEYVPYTPESSKYTREDTFVINVQFTKIYKRTDSDPEAFDNEIIGENVRKMIEQLIEENYNEPFDDIKVTSVQKFERDLVNSNEG